MERYEHDRNYCKYRLAKFEMMTDGPINRHIDGITMSFKRNNKIVTITTEKDFNFFTLIEIILYLILDPVTTKSLYINNESFILPTTDELLIKFLDEQTNSNKTPLIEIRYKDINDIDNENNCIIYCIFPGYPEDYFRNIELDNWEKRK